jgi:RHS repeat-associated protein
MNRKPMTYLLALVLTLFQVAAAAQVNTPPTVRITAPATGVVQANGPQSRALAATASDADGQVLKVDFFMGDTLLATVPRPAAATSTQFTSSFPLTSPGVYTLTARATDNLGAVTTSAPVTLTFRGPAPVLTAPAAGSAFSGPANVVVTAALNVPQSWVSRVDFYNGAALIGSAAAAPYSVNWADVPVGSYTVSARAVYVGGMPQVASAAVGFSVGAAPVAAATTLYYVHPDHLGTPRLIEDQAQRTVWRWDQQEPFGLTGLQNDPDGDGRRFEYNLRFAGQYFDAESQLHHNGARDYDPATGRYIQPDPIGLAGGISLYGYVGGNPLGFVDPLGLARCGPEGVGEYEVGTYNSLKGRSIPDDGIEIHHAVQKHPAGQVVPGYDPKSGPSIALPRGEHREIPTMKGGYAGSARDLLAKDIRDLRTNTNAPNSALRELIQLNKDMFPGAFAR